MLKDMEKSRLEREGRQDRVQAAEQDLKHAEAARAAGGEPFEGERIGAAGGTSRLTESCFERQRRLEKAVESARRELDAARSLK